MSACALDVLAPRGPEAARLPGKSLSQRVAIRARAMITTTAHPIVDLDAPGGVARAVSLASNARRELVLFFAYGAGPLTGVAPRAVRAAHAAGVHWSLILTLNRASCYASLSACPCAFGGVDPIGSWQSPRDPPDRRVAASARQLLRVRVYWLARFFDAGANVFQCDLDVVWTRDPFPLFRANPNVSFFAQADGPVLNSGLDHVQHVSASADAVATWLLNEWSNRMSGLGGDEQTTLNDVLFTMARGKLYLSEQLAVAGRKSHVIASWERRGRTLVRLASTARRSGSDGGAWREWRLTVPAETSPEAYASAIEEVAADCRREREQRNARVRADGRLSAAERERAQEVRVHSEQVAKARLRSNFNGDSSGDSIASATASAAVGSCEGNTRQPGWEWIPGVSRQLPLPPPPPPGHSALAVTMKSDTFAYYQTLSRWLSTPTVLRSDPAACAGPVHLSHLASYPSKSLRPVILDLMSSASPSSASSRMQPTSAPSSWVALAPQSWDSWPEEALQAGRATRAVLAALLGAAHHARSTLVLPGLPPAAAAALTQAITRPRPHLMSHLPVGCPNRSNAAVWIPYPLFDVPGCTGRPLSVAELMYNGEIATRRVLADSPGLRPTDWAETAASGTDAHMGVFADGTVKWLRRPPSQRCRGDAGGGAWSWRLTVTPLPNASAWAARAAADLEEQRQQDAFEHARGFMCRVASGVEEQPLEVGRARRRCV